MAGNAHTVRAICFTSDPTAYSLHLETPNLATALSAEPKNFPLSGIFYAFR